MFASCRQGEEGAGGGLSGGHSWPYHVLREAEATSRIAAHLRENMRDEVHQTEHRGVLNTNT